MVLKFASHYLRCVLVTYNLWHRGQPGIHRLRLAAPLDTGWRRRGCCSRRQCVTRTTHHGHDRELPCPCLWHRSAPGGRPAGYGPRLPHPRTAALTAPWCARAGSHRTAGQFSHLTEIREAGTVVNLCPEYIIVSLECLTGIVNI